MTTAKVITRDVPLRHLDEIGTTAAYETVQIQGAGEPGQIIAREFKDGGL